MIDEPNRPFPDLIEIELCVDPDKLGESTGFLLSSYRGGSRVCHQGRDTSGEIDVAVIGFERATLAVTIVYRALTSNQLRGPSNQIEVDTSLLEEGFAHEHKVVVISFLTREIVGIPGQYSRPACIGTHFSEVLS